LSPPAWPPKWRTAQAERYATGLTMANGLARLAGVARLAGDTLCIAFRCIVHHDPHVGAVRLGGGAAGAGFRRMSARTVLSCTPSTFAACRWLMPPSSKHGRRLLR